ncbi:MAG: hypothetical protein OXC37_06420 [Bdellovibrionaceae bacterium]|nr:hypothetical protein [Pseudobdellovibrionaceae bacterium]
MKCYKYLLIVSLLLGFEVQANQEITNKSNKDGAWLTCVNKETSLCRQINTNWIVYIEYNNKTKITKFYDHLGELYHCTNKPIEGMHCLNFNDQQ